MKTKYTPGPWEADGYYIRQKSTGTRMIADVCYTGPHHTPPDEYPKSCRLVDESNARLIAAAPELLESLETMVSAMVAYEGDVDGEAPSEHHRMMSAARTAIAKAKGETP